LDILITEPPTPTVIHEVSEHFKDHPLYFAIQTHEHMKQKSLEIFRSSFAYSKYVVIEKI